METEKEMLIQIPEKVAYVIGELTKHGYEAYAVGGCVRDAVLGRSPEDWDITTSALPEQVKQIFLRTVDTGIQHGTVTVLVGNEQFEVTTYRLDGEYEDCRHPKEVSFTRNLKEDLCRRDFTINAMAYNDETGMIDLYEGMTDINQKLIRCVGSAEKRFDEDALRILRAVRFSAQLGFRIEEETKAAATMKAMNLVHISAERIRVELSKLLLSPYPDRMMLAYELGITKYVMPEFDELMKQKLSYRDPQTAGEYTVHAIEAVNKLSEALPKKQRLMLAFAVLLHQMKTPAKKLLMDLKFDNETIGMVTHLLKFHTMEFVLTPYGMRQALHQVGKQEIDMLFLVKHALVLAMREAGERDAAEKEMEILRKAEDFCRDIIDRQECVTLKELCITGNDLITLGLKPGKEIGLLLDQLLSEVLERPELNNKETLIYMVKEKMKSD